MGSTPLTINNGGPRSVKFKGTWLKFSCLLDYVTFRTEEDAKEEMAAAQIARKHLNPQKNISKEKKPVIEKEEQNKPSSSLPVLPRNFSNAIDEMGGTNVMLVMEKFLYRTDVESNNGRLAIMFSQIQQNFLTETERRSLENGEDMEVMIIEPSLNVRTIVMTQWDMKKKKKKKKKSGETTSSSMYALKKQWNDVVRDNGLKENDELQVWSFRSGEELRLALVLAKRAT